MRISYDINHLRFLRVDQSEDPTKWHSAEEREGGISMTKEALADALTAQFRQMILDEDQFEITETAGEWRLTAEYHISVPKPKASDQG